MAKSATVGKIHPNGEFAIWWERQYDDARDFRESQREQERLGQKHLQRLRESGSGTLPSGNQWPPHSDPCPLLTVWDNLSSGVGGAGTNPEGALGLSKGLISRTARGARGINSDQRRRIRNACYLLESWSPTGTLVMGTFTFPALGRDQWGAVAKKWSVTLNRFLSDGLLRDLSGTGVVGAYAGCVEIQTKRLRRTGELGLHVHCLFQNRVERGKGDWVLSIDRAHLLWSRAWSKVLPGVDFPSQSVDLTAIRLSASAYVSKYLSKGVGDVERFKEVSGGWHPSAWVFCSAGLKRQIEKNTSYGREVGAYLEGALTEEPEIFPWTGEVRIGETEESKGALISVYGRSEIKNPQRTEI